MRALVVEGAVASLRGLAREKLASFWLTWPLQIPLALTIDDSFRPLDHVAALSPVPILIVQSEADPIVPPDQAKSLYAAAREPKALWLVPNAGHGAVFADVGMQQRLLTWLAVTAGTRPG